MIYIILLKNLMPNSLHIRIDVYRATASADVNFFQGAASSAWNTYSFATTTFTYNAENTRTLLLDADIPKVELPITLTGALFTTPNTDVTSQYSVKYSQNPPLSASSLQVYLSAMILRAASSQVTNPRFYEVAILVNKVSSV